MQAHPSCLRKAILLVCIVSSASAQIGKLELPSYQRGQPISVTTGAPAPMAPSPPRPVSISPRPANDDDADTKAILKEIEEANEAARAEKIFRGGLKTYEQARRLLEQMLLGKIPLSLKDAYYILEHAYGGLHLSYEDYTNVLRRSATFIRMWLKQNGYSLSNREALHFGIQSFLGDSLMLHGQTRDRVPAPVEMHLPFVYDFKDFMAEEDLRNSFVTKTLATGTGQCNTLPMVYLLLAEQLGVQAYLSYAPNHALIKYKSQDGAIQNYEPTTHYSITDAWYIDHMQITTNALQHHVYLDTLTKKQIVAAALLDLAQNFLQKYQVVEENFVNRCVDTAMAYFPGESNLQGWALRGDLAGAKLFYLMRKNGVRDARQVGTVVETRDAYAQLLVIDKTLRDLGWMEYSQTFNAKIDEQTKKGRLPTGQDPKAARNLFVFPKP
ncbi:transglutaminase family protein [Chryseolinea lacunae]|uniref:Protein SirB1 N-terminal domain-containing protein n=1 Tax=Chryseolinea lacunae TaxID=2801331 RepID=A0ABS1L2K9_9BACT|nr:transglutaminase family protein [Chryseolinea lacunae]MBL0745953.1 hypothetical protein [Chryseolinea lacunae]